MQLLHTFSIEGFQDFTFQKVGSEIKEEQNPSMLEISIKFFISYGYRYIAMKLLCDLETNWNDVTSLSLKIGYFLSFALT